MPELNSRERADLVCEFADDIKAEQIELLEVGDKTPVADFFVICTGTSDTHVNSIVARVEEKMAESGIKPLRSQTEGAGWLILDYGDVVLHVMREERRQFYDLETLWKTIEPNPDLLPNQ